MAFIHERSDWPNFRWSHERLASPLASVRHRQGRLFGRMEGLGFPDRQGALLQTLTQDVLKSSEIEGERLDRVQVRSSIARRLGIDIGGLTPTDRQVDGVVEMMLDATQQFANPLSAERLQAWHRAPFPTGSSGLRAIEVGRWRTAAGGPMQVISGPIGKERVHFQAPDADRLEGEMRTFLRWFEDGDDPIDPVLRAGIAHLWFITIHPFEDGNGRIARAITDLELARSEGSPQRFYSMSAQVQLERAAYYQHLESTQRGDLDITFWLEWFLGCMGRAIDGAEGILESVFRKARFWKAHAGEPLNQRQRAMIERLFDGFVGKLTSSKWAKLAKCSQDTALRDINDLVQRGILVRESPGGRSTSYALIA